jgi:Nucleotidyltransferase of unknown function (DUF6036)
MPVEIPPPWKEFLARLDALLYEPVRLDCIGGFAVVMGYGLLRATNDLDYRTLKPFSYIQYLEGIAGRESALARTHGVYVQYTGVDSIPENYEDRLTELFPDHFKNLRLFVPDPYDLILSKLCRNIERDRQDVEFLARTQRHNPSVLRERYLEMIPNLIGPRDRHEATLEFWLEAYFAQRPDEL